MSRREFINISLPAPVAPGDQEVAGSIPAMSATFFRGDLIIEYFLRSFSPFLWFKKAVVSFWQKNVHDTGKPLRD